MPILFPWLSNQELFLRQTSHPIITITKPKPASKQAPVATGNAKQVMQGVGVIVMGNGVFFCITVGEGLIVGGSGVSDGVGVTGVLVSVRVGAGGIGVLVSVGYRVKVGVGVSTKVAAGGVKVCMMVATRAVMVCWANTVFAAWV